MGFREPSLTPPTLALPTLLVPLLLLLMMITTGCRTTPGPAGDRGAPPDDDAVRWPYWPVDMRVHPLSRLVRERGSTGVVIEARIEFFDGDRHTTKAYGEIRLDLFEAAAAPWEESVADWNLDLRDAEVNRTHFDDITSTYLFRLEVVADQLPERPELQVYFVSPDGAELEADLKIRTR